MNCFLLAAVTADGFIGRHADDRSFDWTSAADKQFYVSQIKTADAIVMGRRSFETFTRYPKDSRWILYTRQTEEFVNPKPDVIMAETTQESPAELLQRLEQEGVESVAICGGASIYTMFIKAKVVNKVFLTVEPIFFGQGIKLFSQEAETNLTLLNTKQLSEQTILLEYQVNS